MLERIKEHWFVTLVIVCAVVVSSTWMIAMQIRVEPLVQENAYLRDRLAESGPAHQSPQAIGVLPRTSLATGQTVPTADGACTIGLEEVRGDTAYMVLIAGNKPPSRSPMEAGDNWQASVPGARYYFFILDVHEGVAVVSAYRIGEPSGL